MNYLLKGLAFGIVLSLFSACIGDDIIDDAVEPTIRITNPIDTLEINTSYTFEFSYFNNVGVQEQITDFTWYSSDPAIISVNADGVVTANTLGEATIGIQTTQNGQTITDEQLVIVGESTVVVPSERSGVVETTSSYALFGTFTLKEVGDNLELSFAGDYNASTALPGLYVYLTNNPSTTTTAFEIGAVQVFNGAHTYTIEGVGINDYDYVLYFCKPFNVKVGDGAIE